MEYNGEYYLLHIMQQSYSSLISVSNKLQITGNQYCEKLTSRQYMAMLAVLHLPEDETTIVNIAKKLGTTKQNIAQIIKSLEKKDFIYVKTSEKDKRAVNVCLTDSGIDIMVKSGASISVDFMADIFKGFNKEEIETLWKLLKKLYRFDGVEMDGFEENVTIPDIDEKEVRSALERFSNRRNAKILDT
ncbi:DNA-binding MarR family transcriptional regulator [Orenia metallireducens]|uniref:DNA-binding transcriptional regulator, MarR family n=1 Tax=Orenia metallireducens TaxID=1413210 RepID=A0A285G0K9_9FIRM|nr:MarR family winged helix-turn-helix transcriptional regulator [Orenia metallireducens]PRX31749.1 DNA-binding MarR family transcriptional regulator [Orenia metallireducens]SNY17069.1 DNA-binding transcriptional regulator, MarR family [Orenia metallireducens]